MDKKIFCGSGKQMSESWIKATINPDVIVKHIEEYKGKKFVRLNINLQNQPNNFGKDVSISIDTWKPKQKEKEMPLSQDEELVLPPDEELASSEQTETGDMEVPF